jgi:hypothetical protein
MRRPLLTSPRILVSLLVLGCSSAPVSNDAEAADAGALDAALHDVGNAEDAAMTSGGVMLTYRGNSAVFERARFGYSRSAGEITGVYFEIARENSTECPTETSPTPNQLLIVHGFSSTMPGVRTEDDGIRVSFFDFEGTFRHEVMPASATAVRLELIALDSAVGTADAMLSATFEEGSVDGTFTATHCDSLDADE